MTEIVWPKICVYQCSKTVKLSQLPNLKDNEDSSDIRDSSKNSEVKHSESHTGKKMSVWFPNTSLNMILTVSFSFNRTWKRRERKFDLLGFGAIKGAYLVDSWERRQSKDTKVVS